MKRNLTLILAILAFSAVCLLPAYSQANPDETGVVLLHGMKKTTNVINMPKRKVIDPFFVSNRSNMISYIQRIFSIEVSKKIRTAEMRARRRAIRRTA